MDAEKLSVLSITEYNQLATKKPTGSYDRETRRNLIAIIEKLRKNTYRLSRLEQKLFRKFRAARFTELGEKDKQVIKEVAHYRVTSNFKRTLKVSVASLGGVLLILWLSYHVLLGPSGQHSLDTAYASALHQLGLMPEEEAREMQEDLTHTENSLKKTRQENLELAQMLDRMIQNNQVTKNFKFVVKRIYNDPRTEYLKSEEEIALFFDGRRLGRFQSDPQYWYLLGVIDSGVIRVYYKDEQLMEIESIFGRKGEETPTGEYEIKNKIHKPTWYKKEMIDGRKQVRAIPFGDPEHEIGYWWMGLKKLGRKVPGSYGIHGVNATKFNEFIRKKFDWRSGSAGCPNIRAWDLEFLARVLPQGTRVNIVQSDKSTSQNQGKSA